MADRKSNIQYAESTERFYTTDDNRKLDWGQLLSTHDYDGFKVVKVLNATCSGHCYGQGGPAEWLTVIDAEVVGSEATKRRARLIGEAIISGNIETTGDTSGRLDGYLIGMAVWNYEGPAPTVLQKREIDALLKD